MLSIHFLSSFYRFMTCFFCFVFAEGLCLFSFQLSVASMEGGGTSRQSGTGTVPPSAVSRKSIMDDPQVRLLPSGFPCSLLLHPATLALWLPLLPLPWPLGSCQSQGGNRSPVSHIKDDPHVRVLPCGVPCSHLLPLLPPAPCSPSPAPWVPVSQGWAQFPYQPYQRRVSWMTLRSEYPCSLLPTFY